MITKVLSNRSFNEVFISIMGKGSFARRDFWGYKEFIYIAKNKNKEKTIISLKNNVLDYSFNLDSDDILAEDWELWVDNK